MPNPVHVHLADGNHTEYEFMPEQFQGVMGEVWGSRIYVAVGQSAALVDVIESIGEVERLVREARK